MAKYADRFGKAICEGDVILQPIYINHDTWVHRFTFPFHFMIYKVVKEKGKLKLDSFYTWGWLKDSAANCHEWINLSKLPKNVDMRDVYMKMKEVSTVKENTF